MECEKVMVLELVSDSATLQQGLVGITETICYMMVSGVQHKIILNDRWVGPEIRKLQNLSPVRMSVSIIRLCLSFIVSFPTAMRLELRLTNLLCWFIRSIQSYGYGEKAPAPM